MMQFKYTEPMDAAVNIPDFAEYINVSIEVT
jgi:hypothetical protein